MGPVNVPANFEVRRFTRSLDNSDWSFAFPVANDCGSPRLSHIESLDITRPTCFWMFCLDLSYFAEICFGAYMTLSVALFG